MRIKLFLKGVKYFVLNPRYTMLYFLGKPETVVKNLTGEPISRFFELRENLESDLNFINELQKRTSTFAHESFRLNLDHYFLYAIVRLMRPELILETGVFDGYYTVLFLKALHDNYKNESIDGRLVSIDLPAYESIAKSTSKMHRTHLPEGCGPGWVIPENLRTRWELNLGDSRELLPIIAKQVKNISMFFHDSLHTYSHMTFEYETVWPLLKKGGILMSHDIHWNRAFGNFVQRHRQKEFVARGFGTVKKR